MLIFATPQCSKRFSHYVITIVKLWRFNVNFYDHSIAMSLTRFTFQTTITASPSLSTAFFSVSSFTPWVQNVVQLYIILCVLWSDVAMLSFNERSPSPRAPSSSSLEIRFHSAQTFQLTTVRQTASIDIIKVSKCATSKETSEETNTKFTLVVFFVLQLLSTAFSPRSSVELRLT